MSNKLRNKRIKCRNGNRNKSIHIVQWNLGSRQWQNKLDEIQLLVDELLTDIAFITEANLWEGVSDHLCKVEGYELLQPLTISRLGYSRIVAMVNENLQYRVLTEHMEDDLSTFWLKVGGRGTKGVIVGGIYREHTLLGQPESVETIEQERRWSRILKQWKNVSSNQACAVVGDMNIDMNK